MVTRVMRALLWFASVATLGVFIMLFTIDAASPPANNPVEPVVLEQAARLASGHSPYSDSNAASPGALPAMPGVVAVAFNVFGPSPVVPRAITVLMLIGAALWLAWIVRSETKSWTYGASSAGLILAGYALLAGPLEGARTEPLMLILVLAGGDVLRRGRDVPSALVAGCLFSAAAFAHVAALVCTAVVLMGLSFERPVRALGCAGAMAVVFGGGWVALSLLAGPWFNFSAWDAMFLGAAFEPLGFVRFVGQGLLGSLGVLTLMTVLAFALPVRPWLGPTGIWACIGGGWLAAAVLSTQSLQPGSTAMILSVAALALVGPIMLQRVTQHLSAWPGSNRLGGQGVVLTALLLQFIALASRVPTLRFGP